MLIDLVLVHYWARVHRQASSFVLRMSFAHEIRISTESSSLWVSHSRKYLLLPVDEPIDHKPVIVPILNHNHYFLAIFNYLTRRAYVLGQKINEEGFVPRVDWKSWRGEILWMRIARIFGWETQSEGVLVSGVNWKQVCDTWRSRVKHSYL